MICPKKVQDICLFGMMCPREAVVDDDGECADFIRSTLALMDAKGAARPDRADPVEAAEMQQEREAIQGECEAPKPCPFCGGKAQTGILASCLWIVGCETPECFGNINHLTMYFTDEEFAIATWNRRAENVADV